MKNGKGDYGIISLAEYYEGKEKDVSVRKGHENATNERQRRAEEVDGENISMSLNFKEDKKADLSCLGRGED